MAAVDYQEGKRRPAREVDVDEVLPPRGKELGDPFFRLVARLLDDFLRVPGTNLRFGLDPLLGLLPGIGDSLSGLISTLLLSQSLRHRVPKVILFRMAMNILINAAVGAVPVIGDAFSFWFKSNVRNYDLLQKHSGQAGGSTRGDWLFILGLTAAVAFLLLLVIAGVLAMVARVIGHFPDPWAPARSH